MSNAMHIDTDLWVYLLSDAMSWNVLSTQVIFGSKLPKIFYLTSDRFPVVSVLNKFMKMYCNTISIVHSNFRRKESLYLFIQALFLSWTDTGFRDLQFSLVQSTQMGSDISQ